MRKETLILCLLLTPGLTQAAAVPPSACGGSTGRSCSNGLINPPTPTGCAVGGCGTGYSCIQGGTANVCIKDSTVITNNYSSGKITTGPLNGSCHECSGLIGLMCANCAGVDPCSCSCLGPCNSAKPIPPPRPLAGNTPAPIPGTVPAGCGCANPAECCGSGASALCCPPDPTTLASTCMLGSAGYSCRLACPKDVLNQCTDCTCTSGCSSTTGSCAITPICSNQIQGFRALVRAFRRGELAIPFQKTPGLNDSAPGDEASTHRWGSAYDTDTNLANFGVWSDSATLPLHNHSEGAFTSHTGTPAKGAYVQIGDPTSRLTRVSTLNTADDFHQTAFANVLAVMGPDSLSPGALQPPSWPVYIAQDAYQAQPTTVIAGPASVWTLLNADHAGVSGPPQPCDPHPCDTDQLTITTASVYGITPDSSVPYALIEHAKPWAIVTGTVTSGSPLRGIAVVVRDTQTPARFPPIEKITNSSGVFRILVPSTGSLAFDVNYSTTPAPYTLDTHFYDPRYAPATSVVDVTVASGTQAVGVIALAVNPLNVGTAFLQGLITAPEGTHAPLPGLIVELRDASGRLLRAATTNSAGIYTFTGLVPMRYYLATVPEARWHPNPAQRLVTVPASGLLPGPATAFEMGGVRANLLVNAPSHGVVIAVVPFGDPVGGLPPMIDHRAAQTAVVYSAVTDWTKSALIEVPPSTNLDVYCWRLIGESFQKSGPVNVTAPYGAPVPVTCS